MAEPPYDDWVFIWQEGEHSPAATLVLRHQVGELSDGQLVEALLEVRYRPGPTKPASESPEEAARWWRDVEAYDYTGPGTWGELESMAGRGYLPAHVMQEVARGALARNRDGGR